jgi:hypothetical protein
MCHLPTLDGTAGSDPSSAKETLEILENRQIVKSVECPLQFLSNCHFRQEEYAVHAGVNTQMWCRMELCQRE